jgi:uncharacterized protein (TIGR02453 family)
VQHWFEAHRAEYDTALARFEDLVAALIIEMSGFEDLDGVTPDQCMFRIHRDVRFSKDKTPYKTYMSADIGRCDAAAHVAVPPCPFSLRFNLSAQYRGRPLPPSPD